MQICIKTLRMTLAVILYGTTALILSSFGSISFLSASLIRVVMSTAILLWFILRLLDKEKTPADWIFPWLAFFLMWFLIQAGGQRFHLAPFFPFVNSWDERINLFVMFFTAVGFFLISREVTRSRTAVLFFLQFFIFLSTGVAVYLIFIVLTSPDVAYFWLVPSIPFVENLRPWVGGVLHPNMVIKLFYPGAFYSLSLVFYAYTLRAEHPHPPSLFSWGLLNLCFTCVLIGAIFLTRSRAGIIAFGIAFFLFWVCFTFSHQEKRRALRRFSFFFGVVILFLLSLGLKDVIREVQTVVSTFAEETQLKGARSLTIGAAWHLVKTNGLLGVGLGNYQMGWLFNHRAPFDYLPGATFNDVLWIWAETGLPGIVCFLSAFLLFIVRGLIRAVRTESYFISYFLLASIASLLALFLHSCVDPVFYISPLLWVSFIVLGIGASCFDLKSRPEEKEAQKKECPKFLSRFFFFGALTVLLMAAGAGGITFNKVRAYLLVQKERSEISLRRAGRLDPLNPIHRERLSSHYFQKYQKNGEPDFLKTALEALDGAIALDLLDYDLDVRRAEMLLAARDLRGVTETFERMRGRLPNFYLAEIGASIFYMEESVQLKDGKDAGYLEDLAIQHYKKALEIYPLFPETYRIYNLGSDEANARYQKLKEEQQI